MLWVKSFSGLIYSLFLPLENTLQVKSQADFTLSHEDIISLWIVTSHIWQKTCAHDFCCCEWAEAVGEVEQFSLSFYSTQELTRDEAIWKPVVKNCTWIWKCKPVQRFILNGRNINIAEVTSISSAYCSIFRSQDWEGWTEGNLSACVSG